MKRRTRKFNKAKSDLNRYKSFIISKSVLSKDDVLSVIKTVRSESRNQSVANNTLRELLKIRGFISSFSQIVKGKDLDVVEYELSPKEGSTIDENLEFVAIILSFFTEELKFLTKRMKDIEISLLNNEFEKTKRFID